MDAVYHWVGFAVVHAAVVFMALAVLYFLKALFGAFVIRFLNSPAGNLYWVCKDLLHYLFTGRARWQGKLTVTDTLDMVTKWNSRTAPIARLRRVGPYRRSLLAWIVRRQRAAGLLQIGAR